MKKLFTTLVLLGAFGAAQAQVTVTDFDASKGTVTINYDKSQGLYTDEMVGQVIRLAFEGDPGQGIAPTVVSQRMDKRAREEAVNKIILTGDWDNYDSHKDKGKTLKKVVDEFSSNNNPVTLDLSQCQNFVSKFISVKDEERVNGEWKVLGPKDYTTGIKDNWVETTFTYSSKSPDKTVSGTATKSAKYYYTYAVDPNGNPYDWATPYTGTVNGSDGNFTDENNQPLVEIAILVDENGNALDPNVVTDDGNGNYTYSYVIEGDDTEFAVNSNYNLDGIIFPKSSNFTFIPNSLFSGATKLKTVELPEGIVAIGNEAFAQSGVETINFPSSLTDIGGDAFLLAKALTAADLSKTKLTSLRWMTFQDCWGIVTMDFPTTLIEIQKDACQRTKSLVEVDLSKCHDLRMIGQQAFECESGDNGSALISVKVCSHPKTIKGTEGLGAFNNDTNIQTVEVVGCKPTNLVECICENRAFAPDITYVQTAVANVETKGARLIFPQDAYWDRPMQSNAGNLENEYRGYSSAFDYFVGDYKEGVALSKQSNILAYFNVAPKGEHGTAVDDLTGETKDAYCASDNKMAQIYGIGNGWHEFMNVSEGIVLQPNEEFLRTYSRTRGSGAVVLPFGITAYRAVDYISEESNYVKNKYGKLVFFGDPNNPEDLANPDKYLDKEWCIENNVDIIGKPTYNYATVRGKLYLRALRPILNSTGEEDPSVSYVPEETGVVLYSQSLDEEKALYMIFPAYEGDEYDVSKQYPHTEHACEEERTESEPDVINMLQGSYGQDTEVGPVLPWYFKDKENHKGGYYKPSTMEYRCFGFNKSANRWVRLQPGILRYNRAFAKIYIGRFDNNDEQTGQMPDFTRDDMPVVGPEGGSGEANTFLTFGSSFEDEMTDGIQNFSNITFAEDAWYTLQGVKVVKPTKGIYIHNNRKVVIK